MWFEDDDIKKLGAILALHLKRHLAESGGQGKGPLPRLMTVEQTADYIGRTKSAVEKMVFRNELNGCVVRRDRRVFIDRIALDKWIETHRV